MVAADRMEGAQQMVTMHTCHWSSKGRAALEVAVQPNRVLTVQITLYKLWSHLQQGPLWVKDAQKALRSSQAPRLHC